MSSNLTPGKVSPAKSEARSPTNVSFLVDLADIQSMKQTLQELLTSFRAGKLKAFGNTSAIEQMENIRQMQGNLARRHFGLDDQVNYEALAGSKVERNLHDKNMTTLLKDMEQLGNAVKRLDPQAPQTSKQDNEYKLAS